MDFSDLHDLIGPDSAAITWWQMSVRAVIVFAFGILLVRLSGKRTFGKLSAFDIVLAIVVGSNLSRALHRQRPILANPRRHHRSGVSPLHPGPARHPLALGGQDHQRHAP